MVRAPSVISPAAVMACDSVFSPGTSANASAFSAVLVSCVGVLVSSSESGSSCAAWPFRLFPLTFFFFGGSFSASSAPARTAVSAPPSAPPAPPACACSRSSRVLSSSSRCIRVFISSIARLTALSTGSITQSSTLTSSSVLSFKSSSASASCNSASSSSSPAALSAANVPMLIGSQTMSGSAGGGTDRENVSVRNGCSVIGFGTYLFFCCFEASGLSGLGLGLGPGFFLGLGAGLSLVLAAARSRKPGANAASGRSSSESSSLSARAGDCSISATVSPPPLPLPLPLPRPLPRPLPPPRPPVVSVSLGGASIGADTSTGAADWGAPPPVSVVASCSIRTSAGRAVADLGLIPLSSSARLSSAAVISTGLSGSTSGAASVFGFFRGGIVLRCALSSAGSKRESPIFDSAEEKCKTELDARPAVRRGLGGWHGDATRSG